MEQKKVGKKKNKLLLYIGLLLLFIALLIGIFVYLYNNTSWFGGNFGVVDKSTFIEIDLSDLPKESVFITDDRQDYIEDSMLLVIPKLGLNTTVAGDTFPKTLLDRPGLYEYAQMPSEGDVNVSIAGHRDLGKQEFYYLDKVGTGDNMYIIHEGEVYKYEFFSSKVVEADDWSVITRQGFSVLTLTTCDPIGTSLNRLIVVGNLIEHYPMTMDTMFD